MSEGRLLLVEDDASLREALLDTLMLAQYDCVDVESAEAGILALKNDRFDMVISDVQMEGIGGLGLLNYLQQHHPKVPMLLMTAYATIDNAVNAMKLGAVDYLAKPFSPEVLLNQVSRYLPAKSIEGSPVVADEKSLALLSLAQRVAVSDASVMIMGPSGSGKEVLARYIHQHSQRATEPFVAINCAAIPENMLEATLFGATRKGRLLAHIKLAPESLSKHKAVRYCWMKFLRWKWVCKLSYCACFKSVKLSV